MSVTPEDREKTAFVAPDGLWESLRLPFGVSGGSTTFQRVIEIVLSGLTYQTCLCYNDDIIIPSDSIQQQCKRLDIVLYRFQKHNLHVKASKCYFGAHRDPRNIEAVSNLSFPTNVDQVRSFLGLAEIIVALFLIFLTFFLLWSVSQRKALSLHGLPNKESLFPNSNSSCAQSQF